MDATQSSVYLTFVNLVHRRLEQSRCQLGISSSRGQLSVDGKKRSISISNTGVWLPLLFEVCTAGFR